MLTAFLLGNKSQKHSLFLATFLAFGWQFVLITIPKLTLVGFNIAQPFLVQATLLFVQGGTAEPVYYGYGLIGAYLLVYLGIAVSCPS